MAAYNDEDLEVGDIINQDDNLNKNLRFHYEYIFDYLYKHYAFVNWYDRIHITIKTSGNAHKLNTYWILLDSHSTVNLFFNRIYHKISEQQTTNLLLDAMLALRAPN